MAKIPMDRLRKILAAVKLHSQAAGKGAGAVYGKLSRGNKIAIGTGGVLGGGGLGYGGYKMFGSRNPDPPARRSGYHQKTGPVGRAKIAAIGHELSVNEPQIVGRTRQKYGAEAARRQKIAIMLSKARRAGVRGLRREGE